MARPQRKNVDYFPHYISDGKKMFYFESKYGNDGYAMWFKLLEKLAQTNDHFIDFEDKTELMYMAAKCRVTEETLSSFLDELCTFGDINTLLWKECRVVWIQKFIDSIEDAYSRRSNKCMSFDGLCSHLHSNGRLKKNRNPQSKVKQSKEEKSKEKEYPLLDEFVAYGNEKAKEIGISLDASKLKAKFLAWEANGWKTLGKPSRKISNWKSTLTNSLEYLKTDQKPEPSFHKNR